MYSSLASILDMFIFPVFFAFFDSTYSFLFEKETQNHWETPVKMREGLFVLVFAVFCNVVNRAAA